MNKTPIEWTHWSVNPFKMRMPDGTLINACVHKSDGCRNCYAESIVRRWWKKEWGEFPGYTAALLKLGTPMLVEDELKAVLRLSDRIAKGKADPNENKIFWNDMTDEFLEFWPDDFLDGVNTVRAVTRNLIHQVLTKRIERAHGYLKTRELATGMMLDHVWLGVSVEDQKTADERIPLLLQTPAAVRWISAEPLLGEINLLNAMCGYDKQGYRRPLLTNSKLDWVVVGGESGPKARPMHPDWARSLRDQCVAVGVPFFFKQWGNWITPQADLMTIGGIGFNRPESYSTGHQWSLSPRCEEPVAYNIGKKAAGRLLDGKEWNEFPVASKVSQA